MHELAIPPGYDDLRHRAKLRDKVRALHGGRFKVVGVDMTRCVALLVETEPVTTFTRVQNRVQLTLGAGARGTDVRRLITTVKQMYGQDFELVDLNLDAGTAIAARLDPHVAQVREVIAAQLPGLDPWCLDVTVRRDKGEVSGYRFRIPLVRYNPTQVDRIEQTMRSHWQMTGWTAYLTAPGEIAFLPTVADPLAGTVPYTVDKIGAPTATRVPFAVTETGEIFAPPILETHWLIGGVPGSGKSGTLTALLASMSQAENVAMLMIDPKMVEFSLWKPRATHVAIRLEDGEDMLASLIDEMERRYLTLSERGLKKVSKAMLDEFPLLVVICDELAEITASGVTKEEKQSDLRRSQHLRRLAAKGRAAGVSLILATQRPSADLVPTSLRDILQMRVCHATTNPTMTDIVLGSSMHDMAAAHQIPITQRGVGYALSETDREPTKIRSLWMEDDLVADHVASVKHLRVDLPWLPGAMARHRAEREAEEDGGSGGGGFRSTTSPRWTPPAVEARPALVAVNPADDDEISGLFR